jgi:hypothetical protein
MFDEIIAQEVNLMKAIKSNDKAEIIKSVGDQLKSIEAENKGIKEDPFYLYTISGYKPKTSVSLGVLALMAAQPNMNAIRIRRKNQIASFAKRQKDKFSTGFIINKKDNTEVTPAEKKEIEFLYSFFENCGSKEIVQLNEEGKPEKKNRDGDLSTFLRNITDYSIIYDHAPYEVVLNRFGQPVYFETLDPHTIKQADSFLEQTYTGNRQKKNGQYPKWVQIINELEVACFYEDEIDVVIRNFQDNIYNYGYGKSELEDLITVITDLNNAYRHNGKAFSEILADRIINIKGEEGRSRLHEFRQIVRATLMGAANSHGNLVTSHEKGLEIIKLNENNKDMEYSNWIRILVSLLCSLYVISPEEINFESVKSAASPLGEKNNEKLLKYSKDSGMRPILVAIQDSLNKKVTSKFYDNKYEIQFVGLEAESVEDYQARMKTRLETINTVNEIRAEENLEPLEYGDIILNPQYIQWVQFMEGQKAQQQQSQQQPNENGSDEPDEPDDDEDNDEEDTPPQKVNKSVYKSLDKDNIYQILISEYLNKIENV